MKQKNDKGYLDQGHIIELPKALLATSKISIDGHEYPAQAVRESLRYQLGERMYCVKPPDPVVADLLFTYAILEANYMVVESGIDLLTLARTYGFRNTALLDRKTEQFEWIVRFRNLNWDGLVLLEVVAFMGFLCLAYRKGWFFMGRKARLRHQDRLSHKMDEDDRRL